MYQFETPPTMFPPKSTRTIGTVQIEPPIQEEDDGLSAAQPLDESAKRSSLPAPVQYDPKTSTTTLTKKVFAGYQQVITTKSPEGKTRTQTKTVYDPSVDEDDSKGVDQVDAPVKVASVAAVATSKPIATPPEAKPTVATPPEAKPTVATRPTPTSSSPARSEPEPTPKKSPSPARASPRPQMQQQVAQESMAGKDAPDEPVKSLRRKRLSSPQVTPPTTPPVTQTLSSPSLTTPKTAPSKTGTVTKPLSSAVHSKRTEPALPSSAATATNTSIHHHSLPPALSRRRQPNEPAPQTSDGEQATSEQPQSAPLVPPRRKRESKTARIGKARQ